MGSHALSADRDCGPRPGRPHRDVPREPVLEAHRAAHARARGGSRARGRGRAHAACGRGDARALVARDLGRARGRDAHLPSRGRALRRGLRERLHGRSAALLQRGRRGDCERHPDDQRSGRRDARVPRRDRSVLAVHRPREGARPASDRGRGRARRLLDDARSRGRHRCERVELSPSRSRAPSRPRRHGPRVVHAGWERGRRGDHPHREARAHAPAVRDCAGVRGAELAPRASPRAPSRFAR